MNLHDLKPFPEERKQRKRVGRGQATGWGCTCGKGNKGQNSRAGASAHIGFEGGQMPLQRRLPKRGFKNYLFKTVYAPINLDRLEEAFAGKTDISLEDIYDRGLASRGALVKILGEGDLSRALNVEAHRFSKSAVLKLKAAGGEARPLEPQTEATETAAQEG